MKKFLLVMMLVLACLPASMSAQQKKAVKRGAAKPRVEVLYFHSKQRCATCIAIGKYTQEVLTQDFAAQMKSGQVKFKEIDISTPEGEKIADEYKVTWSSLFVNQWKNGREIRNDMTQFGFGNARSNTPAFKAGLKNKILQLVK